MFYLNLRVYLVVVGLLCLSSSVVDAQNLQGELEATPVGDLVAQVQRDGDPIRGAVVFFQPTMACAKCHSVDESGNSLLGPNLSSRDGLLSNEDIVESVLLPSKVIHKGYESATVLLEDGSTVTGIIQEEQANKLVLRDASQSGRLVELAKDEIAELKRNEKSIMPEGQANQLNSRQQFLDLVKYLIEIRDGGPARAKVLQPSQALLTLAIPEYESHLDHAGLIQRWSDESFQRGEAIYNRVCANCHGTHDKAGSLPTSLRFGQGKFKNGSDPLSMYRTITHGFGLMTPQTWMVPSQKYDVIHYIREAYLKTHNVSQYVAIDQKLIDKLPKGDTLGPEPSNIQPWSAMDYGPSLIHTYEIPGGKHNIAYKGIAVRLDPGGGGVSRGGKWMIFDTDTLRAAAAWSSTGEGENNFIDWHGIQFDGAHGVHPRIVGQLSFANSDGPGWANPTDGSFQDTARVEGRDQRMYGPLPRSWGKYRGLYHYDQSVVFHYTIGETEILESPKLSPSSEDDLPDRIVRIMNVGPRTTDLEMEVAEFPLENGQLKIVDGTSGTVAHLSRSENASKGSTSHFSFDGSQFLEVEDNGYSELFEGDFSIVARMKTQKDGTICSLTKAGPNWIPNGQTFFIRGGRLAYDIGWVGALESRTVVSDGKWHEVAITRDRKAGVLRFYVDGKLDGEGKLQAQTRLENAVVRIGFTSPDFPQPATYFEGELDDVCFFTSRLTKFGRDAVAREIDDKPEQLAGRWLVDSKTSDVTSDHSLRKSAASVVQGTSAAAVLRGDMVAGLSPKIDGSRWSYRDGRLRLKIPAGDTPLRFSVWLPEKIGSDVNDDSLSVATRFADQPLPGAAVDLSAFTKGGPSRWAQTIQTFAQIGSGGGPFDVDYLTAPEVNPWLAQVRFTGLDFFRDGRLAVCTWDGDVWLVEQSSVGSQLDKSNPNNDSVNRTDSLKWRRIATGLFQPLGLKIVGEKIHVTCRDQLAVLHDLNGDDEIDFYECLNNDHQVTEHFHEFAMGLQTDADGNFYYAKSGCHGKAAVVPQHGTLLRVAKDGSKTEILANGFRAANGVCLNPDGSFFVTDQEGFWNPKNRINWVTLSKDGKPKFYGNMLGYHDVQDTSDSAMEPPLCWITNAFDRSPAELLWVDSKLWGPLNGSLLNLSYGYGKVFLVPHERIGDRMQGGMIELPIPAFPTGVMRGRFSQSDHHLYLCGMFAWAGSATSPGGLYRIRATGKPANLPLEIHAKKSGMQLVFSEPLDPSSLTVQSVRVKAWDIKRTANYGSDHYNERSLEVNDVRVDASGRKVTLVIDTIAPTWCMEISYEFRAKNGDVVRGTIDNTVHELAD